MILNAAPRWEGDVAVQYSFAWNRKLIENLGCEVTELLEEDCTRANYEAQVADAELFIFYDHGSESGLIAQGGYENLVDGRNVWLLKGAEVYTMCCSAAQDLGKEAFRKGVKSWWGYTKPFSFTLDEEDVFCRLANMGLEVKRSSGCSWDSAIETVKDAYDVEIERVQEGNGNPWTIISLVNDRNCLVCWSATNVPPSDCVFRNMGVRIFGLAGHRITRLMAVSMAMGYISFGVALHDFAHALWQVDGYKEILSLQGGYFGFLGMLVANWIFMKEYMKALK